MISGSHQTFRFKCYKCLMLGQSASKCEGRFAMEKMLIMQSHWIKVVLFSGTAVKNNGEYTRFVYCTYLW